MAGGFDGFGSLFLEIGGIVVAFWVALWFVARRGRGAGVAWSTRDCQVLRQLAIGPRERVVVVRIATKQFVLGVGSASVSLISELEEPLPAADTPGGAFADAVRRAMGRWHVG